MRNRFEDRMPAGLAPLDWKINHDEEESTGRERAIEVGGNTGLTGLVRQQGEQSPYTLRFAGTIMEQDQLTGMLAFEEASNTRSVYFRDFNGDEYMVIVTRFVHQRKRVAQNRRDLANAPMHVWKYQIEMHVLTFISGPYADAGVAA